MAKVDTLERRQVLRLQQLGTAPTTADEAARTIEMVVATESPVDGLVLRCQAGAVEYGPAPVPVLLDHQNQTGLMAGRLLSIRFERGQLVAVAQFTAAPAAEEGWQLARAGCAVSVGATFNADAIEPGRGGSPDVVSRWRLREASLVAVGADPTATTRSAPDLKTNPALEGTTMSDNTQTTIDREEQALDRIERRRAAGILDAARKLEVPEAVALDLIERGVPLDEARGQLIDARSAEERRTPGIARVEVGGYGQRQAAPPELLQRGLGECISGKSPRHAVRVLEDFLIASGLMSRVENLSPKEIVARAWATSDFPIALQGLGQREMLSAYQSTQNGLIAAATRNNTLRDFRPVKGLRFSQLGALQSKKEGGEYKATGFSEEAAYELIAKEWGTLITVTRNVPINDDMGMIGRLLQEAGRAGAETDRELLASALNSISWGATNSTESAMGIEALGAGVLLLRRQQDAEKRPVSFEPDLIVAAPEHELELRQLLGDFQPASAGEVQPFSNLRVEIDHRLSDGAFYMVDTRYAPLMIGSIGDPVVSTQEDFRTGNLMLRVQHDAAACVVDTRSIAKVTITA